MTHSAGHQQLAHRQSYFSLSFTDLSCICENDILLHITGNATKVQEEGFQLCSGYLDKLISIQFLLSPSQISSPARTTASTPLSGQHIAYHHITVEKKTNRSTSTSMCGATTALVGHKRIRDVLCGRHDSVSDAWKSPEADTLSTFCIPACRSYQRRGSVSVGHTWRRKKACTAR